METGGIPGGESGKRRGVVGVAGGINGPAAPGDGSGKKGETHKPAATTAADSIQMEDDRRLRFSGMNSGRTWLLFCDRASHCHWRQKGGGPE